jgi:hypothetical protein
MPVFETCALPAGITDPGYNAAALRFLSLGGYIHSLSLRWFSSSSSQSAADQRAHQKRRFGKSFPVRKLWLTSSDWLISGRARLGLTPLKNRGIT